MKHNEPSECLDDNQWTLVDGEYVNWIVAQDLAKRQGELDAEMDLYIKLPYT